MEDRERPPRRETTGSEAGSKARDCTAGGVQADFNSLMNLITTTVQPDSWEELSGPGSVMPYRTTLSLVIRQTQAVHEEIADLLGQLRRLQDLQVTVECRFVTVSDNFFERIGIDFNFNLPTNVSNGLHEHVRAAAAAVRHRPELPHLHHGDDATSGTTTTGTTTTGTTHVGDHRSDREWRRRTIHPRSAAGYDQLPALAAVTARSSASTTEQHVHRAT